MLLTECMEKNNFYILRLYGHLKGMFSQLENNGGTIIVNY